MKGQNVLDVKCHSSKISGQSGLEINIRNKSPQNLPFPSAEATYFNLIIWVSPPEWWIKLGKQRPKKPHSQQAPDIELPVPQSTGPMGGREDKCCVILSPMLMESTKRLFYFPVGETGSSFFQSLLLTVCISPYSSFFKPSVSFFFFSPVPEVL